MTDKELLTFAAKAAAMPYHAWADNFADMTDPKHPKRWNPLADDGDALRLAVSLCMSVTNTRIRSSVLARPDPDFGDWIEASEPHNGDPYAATRRAIVRAAAEIGRKL